MGYNKIDPTDTISYNGVIGTGSIAGILLADDYSGPNSASPITEFRRPLVVPPTPVLPMYRPYPYPVEIVGGDSGSGETVDLTQLRAAVENLASTIG